MKVILLLALLLASSYAFTPFLFEEGHKFLETLKDKDHRCFVLYFKNSHAEGRRVDQEVLSERNNKQQSALENRIQDEPNVTYTVIDIGDPDMNDEFREDVEEFLREAKIDISELDSYPMTFVMDDGIGAYIYGPKHELIVGSLIDAYRTGRLGVV